ncbi:MAG: FtsX-like permease family protein [Bacteroidota bacterium]
MLKHNLLLAIRTLRKQRIFSWVNILGLSLGLLAATFIGDYVYHEYRYDRHHSQADQIFRVSMHIQTAGGYDQHFARITTDFVNTMPESFPEVEQVVRFQNYNPRTVRVGESVFKELHAFSTDAEAFDVFDYPVTQGDPSQALADPYSVVLTESTAQKYFGTIKAVGRSIEILGNNSQTFDTYTVTAVMEDVPTTSHMPITLLTSFTSPEERTGWAYTYLKLRDAADGASVQAKMPDFIAEHTDNPEELSLVLWPLADVHLQSDLAREIVPGGSAWTVPLFTAVGIFILLIALINYMNLSTAQSLARAREIGVRKVMGSSRSQLIRYFLGQSVVFAWLAAMAAALSLPLLLPLYEQLTGFTFSVPILFVGVGLLSIATVVGLGAGLYPAFRLSSFKAISVMKGQGATVGAHPKFNLRHVLVGLQFTISLSLIVCALVAYQQNRFLLKKDLGLQPDQFLAIRQLNVDVQVGMENFRQALLRDPSVLEVTAVMAIPSYEIRDAGNIYAEGVFTDQDEAPFADIQVVDRNYVEALGMELLAGGTFPEHLERPEGIQPFTNWQEMAALINGQQQAYILNETALALVGWTPQEAIGKEFSWSNGLLNFPRGPVVGVVKDFHQESLRNTIDPIVMVYEPQLFNHIMVKGHAEDLPQTMAAIENTWGELFPTQPLDLAFMDDLFAQLYESENQQMLLITTFSVIALGIAFLGLLGLIAYSLKMRSSELAIRRVLGAESSSILWLLSKEYALLLGIGLLIAVPGAWWVLTQWLSGFSYHISLTPWPFVAAALTMALLFLTNIGWQTYRHLKANPARTLREE